MVAVAMATVAEGKRPLPDFPGRLYARERADRRERGTRRERSGGKGEKWEGCAGGARRERPNKD